MCVILEIMENTELGTLYIVATPIGNLEDMTVRAVRIIKEADTVLSEDTRVTQKLLTANNIQKKLLRYDAHSTERTSEFVQKKLEEGKSVALVSDAGTPGISDPGMMLVHEMRKVFGEALRVVPIPGASAVTAALSVSGLPASDFLFLGFLPHKKGRQTLLRELAESKRTVALYESPHRILKLLDELALVVGVERKIVICRELTKFFEETREGNALSHKKYYETHPDKVKGEFVVMVDGL